ncbi:xanthine dehydrogenase family protein subunit M [Aeromicrobium sp. YIM 150415]|uniref:FAD binding domain-containing protein n=1 Tax=Aeromicrobium sp. YIM 150415 TaxID=2803912 RepID=UPI001965CF6D|nr:xanthine dehydrogenase family protein subunit M [Aeromicrobium sp. YIM 150415]MBM9461875.1 xanthine dehydrogenase family protein subunit M [Aeromicrobium sp. YIM 150415]
MNPFDYERATDAAGAVTSVAARPGATFLAGGTNLVDHLKLGITSPELLVDISHLPLTTIEEEADGALVIGANVRNADLAAHPLVQSRHPVLSRALLSGASGQLRNLATTGGNLLQRTRCVYFQDVTTPCNKRVPGSGCSAIGGHTEQHAILGASEHCIAVHPSDMAVALAALDAEVLFLGPDGPGSVTAEELHRLPGDAPEQDTVLDPGRLITAIRIPAPPPGARSTYRKARERSSFAFALVSLAAETVVEDGVITGARLALGGVAHKPWRAHRAEEVLRGAPATTETFTAAAEAELDHARPLEGNAFKVPMARTMMVAALEELTGEDA